MMVTHAADLEEALIRSACNDRRIAQFQDFFALLRRAVRIAHADQSRTAVRLYADRHHVPAHVDAGGGNALFTQIVRNAVRDIPFRDSAQVDLRVTVLPSMMMLR